MSAKGLLAAGLALLMCCLVCLFTCLLVAFLLFSPVWAQSAATAPEVPAVEVSSKASRLSKEDVEKVVDFLFEHLTSSGEVRISAEMIEAATGIRISEHNQNQVLPVLMAKLQTTPEGRAILATVQGGSSCAATGPATADAGSGCAVHGPGCTSSCGAGARQASRCGEYGACSLYGDLSGATGDVLDMHVREKATDGTTYDDFALPAFEANDLEGGAVRSSNLAGKPTLLVFLAGHCSHSFQTLPILQELVRAYEPQGVRVVGVYVNSGSAEDVGSWIDSFEPEYDVWVHPGHSLGDVVGSHLVPTYLLVDEKGMVREKLVGYKSREEVEARLEELMARGPSEAGPVEAGDAGM